MRETQRGSRTYADNTYAGMQQGRNKNENNTEAILPKQDEATSQRNELNSASSEGMLYLDIIPRFAL